MTEGGRPAGAPVRVALVHHWLVTRRGGEKCLDALAGLLPGADLFTLVHDPSRCPAPAGVARVGTSWLQRLPGWRRHFRLWAPLFASLYRRLDVRGHAVIVSSDASLAKAVIKAPGARHVCYCYSPVRWAFDLRETYLAEALPAWLAPMAPLARRALARVAAADRRAAAGVDRFVAVSRHVARRIEIAYGRSAEVVPPPVDTSFFCPGERDRPPCLSTAPWPADQRPYLLLGQSVAYKRFDVAVDACRRLQRPLVVAGSGPRWRDLRRRAGPLTAFVREPDDATVRDLYRYARALLFPGEEDFGLVPVEAMACGTPVVALGLGGAAETVVDGRTGVLAGAPEVEALLAAMARFEALEATLDPAAMVERAAAFSLDSHLRSMKAVLAAAGVPIT